MKPTSGTPATATLIGLMSGTSLDGISAALVTFEERGDSSITTELIRFRSRPYSREERETIAAVIHGGNNDSICRLNFSLGELFAEAANGLISEADGGAIHVDAIASHGQTIWHVPGSSTLQIGESAVIAERTGLPVISDFRVRDVAAGGHGAPLVPIADALLFAAEHPRALQNIGGIGNVTLVPGGGDVNGVTAFDTGPGVVVIDGVVALLTNGAQSYDADGSVSAGGAPVTTVVDQVLAAPFFSMKPPRSTGRELFDAKFIRQFVDDCRRARPDATNADIVATAVELTARSIALAYREFLPRSLKEVLISGGGAKHPLLRDLLQRYVSPMAVRDFAEVYFDVEAKEAVAFALLGFLHLRSRNGNVPGATGASGFRRLGKFTPA